VSKSHTEKNFDLSPYELACIGRETWKNFERFPVYRPWDEKSRVLHHIWAVELGKLRLSPKHKLWDLENRTPTSNYIGYRTWKISSFPLCIDHETRKILNSPLYLGCGIGKILSFILGIGRTVAFRKISSAFLSIGYRIKNLKHFPMCRSWKL